MDTGIKMRSSMVKAMLKAMAETLPPDQQASLTETKTRIKLLIGEFDGTISSLAVLCAAFEIWEENQKAE